MKCRLLVICLALASAMPATRAQTTTAPAPPRLVLALETSAPELQWLTRSIFVGTGERYPTEVVIRFWRLE